MTGNGVFADSFDKCILEAIKLNGEALSISRCFMMTHTSNVQLLFLSFFLSFSVSLFLFLFLRGWGEQGGVTSDTLLL